MIGLIKHIVRGYEVTPETLAFDVMREVIPSGGMFLADMHTVREMRKGAIWVPTLGDAAADPSQVNVVAHARTRVTEILRKHEVAPLSEDVLRHLDKIGREGSPRGESRVGEKEVYRCTIILR